MTPTMPIKCVAPWAGGKRRLAPRIVALLGPHDVYLEPFVGGCSILPVKPRANDEWVYDLNPDVIDVLNELRSYPSCVARYLSACRFSREVYDAARARLASPPDPADPTPGRRALDLLISWWMGPGGIAGTTRKGWFAQRHTKTGGCPEKRWKSFVQSVRALGDRLQVVNPMRANGLGILEGRHRDQAGTAIYCDPPYLSKSFDYACDFAATDHQRLADALNGYTRARIVVSYYDDGAGTLARLYPPARWRRIDVEMSKNMSSAGGGKATGRAVEVLLVNDAGAHAPSSIA